MPPHRRRRPPDAAGAPIRVAPAGAQTRVAPAGAQTRVAPAGARTRIDPAGAPVRVARRTRRAAGLRLAAGALAAALSGFGMAGEALAQRLALVVGNDAYDAVYDLDNAASDATAVAAALERLDFEVTLLTDATGAEFAATLAEFADRADTTEAETVLFYFSGHGFQLGGVNYLVPTDAALSSREAIETETQRLDQVIGRLEKRGRQVLVFLDACRNNPLPDSVRGPGAADGLAQIETGSGSFIAFATQPNNVTFDGAGEHSPFTAAFLEHLEAPGISISDMMIRVRNQVEETTLRQQTPWDQSSLRSQFYFNPVYETTASLTAADYEMLASLDPERRAQFLRLLGETGISFEVTAIEEAEADIVAAGQLTITAAPDEPAPAPAAGTGPSLQITALPEDGPGDAPGDAPETPAEAPFDLAALPDPVAPLRPGTAAPVTGTATRATGEAAARAGDAGAGGAATGDAAAGADAATVRATEGGALVRSLPGAAAEAPAAVAAAAPSGAVRLAPSAGAAVTGPTGAVAARPGGAVAVAPGGAPAVVAAAPGARVVGQEVVGQEVTGQEVTGQEVTGQAIAGREVIVGQEVTPPEAETETAAAPAAPPEAADTGDAAPFELAALAPGAETEATPEPAPEPEPEITIPENLPRAVQTELARVGCYRARVDGLWGRQSALAAVRFYSARGVTPDSLDPTADLYRLLATVDEVVCENTVAVARAIVRGTTEEPAPAAAQPTRRIIQQAPAADGGGTSRRVIGGGISGVFR